MTRIAPETRARAATLRRAVTPQEARLWRDLRDLNRRLGTHFRWQAPIGPFIADFADLGRRLVIELDGSRHGGPRDTLRDAWIEGQGFVVLRFCNDDADRNLERVMQIVLDAIEVAPPLHRGPPLPIPPPQGGREAPGRAR